MNKVLFQPNVIETIALKFPEGKLDQTGRFGDQMFYSLADGRCMYLNLDVSAKLNLLEPHRNETIAICKRWTGKKGDPVQWDIWRPQTGEVNTATAPSPAALAGIPESDIEAEVRAGILARKARAGASVSAPAPVEAAIVRAAPNNNAYGDGIKSTNGNGNGAPPPNGSNGAPKPYLTAGIPAPPVKIPYDVAFRELLQVVVDALKAAGEQWSDAAKQDAVSTLLIQAARDGFLSCWQRGGAR